VSGLLAGHQGCVQPQHAVPVGELQNGRLRRLRLWRRWHTPVLIVTVHVMSGFREQCLEAGADGYSSNATDGIDGTAKRQEPATYTNVNDVSLALVWE